MRGQRQGFEDFLSFTEAQTPLRDVHRIRGRVQGRAKKINGTTKTVSTTYDSLDRASNSRS